MVDVAHVLDVTKCEDNMLRRQFKAILLTLIIILIVASTNTLVMAQVGQPWVYIPETGHNLREPFLSYYKATGGQLRYGYPITDDFVDPQTRMVVQYFQKARLEWHPANPDPYKIQLGLLGTEVGKRTPPILVKDIPSPSDPSCTYFPETGHTVCYRFLEYWRASGGLDSFGYPITEYLNENDVIVQYFQRAKMEWQPSYPADQQIQLTNLGEIYARAGGIAPNLLQPQPPQSSVIGVPTTPRSIMARASILTSVVPSGGMQAAYVMVVDQLSRPIAGAAVSLIVHYPQANSITPRNMTFQLPTTNQDGVTFQGFDAGYGPAGTVVPVEFIISYPGLNVIQTVTSYMLWY